MAGLGIPTTRALALVGAEDPVLRETVETAAVVTRLAPSFVRFGHFEFFFLARAARAAYASWPTMSSMLFIQLAAGRSNPYLAFAGTGGATYCSFDRAVGRASGSATAS